MIWVIDNASKESSLQRVHRRFNQCGKGKTKMIVYLRPLHCFSKLCINTKCLPRMPTILLFYIVWLLAHSTKDKTTFTRSYCEIRTKKMMKSWQRATSALSHSHSLSMCLCRTSNRQKMYTHFFVRYSSKMGKKLLINHCVISFTDKFPKCQTLEDKMMFYWSKMLAKCAKES